MLQEIILFALAALVLFIIRRKERLGWDSVGLQRPALGNTFKWVLITFAGVVAALSVAFGFIKLFKLPVGSSNSAAWDALPTSSGRDKFALTPRTRALAPHVRRPRWSRSRWETRRCRRPGRGRETLWLLQG